MNEFFDEYFNEYSKTLNNFLKENSNKENCYSVVELLKKTRDSKALIYLIGNGGSAAVAEHAAIDFTKNAGLRSLALSGSPMMTTFSNDYGYEKMFQKGVEHFCNENDILIAISSGGTSKNIINACDAAKKKGMTIITFSGFNIDNPLRSKGNYNFWVDSKAFGFVEILHGLIIHYINDAIIGKIEYMIR